MKRLPSAAAAVLLAAGVAASLEPQASASQAAATSTPLWVTHVQKFLGGISNGVRAKLAASGGRTVAGATTTAAPASTGSNVQMNPATPIRQCRRTRPQSRSAWTTPW